MSKITKNAPLKNPILFNGLAIAFILLILPVTIAYTANAQYDFIESDYENSLDGFAGTFVAVKFVENGYDTSDLYDAQENNAGDEADCAYVVPNWELDNPEFTPGSIFGRYFSGICLGDGSQDVINTNRYIGAQGYLSWQSTPVATGYGEYSFRVPQTHANQNLSHGYIGTSGNSGFTWAYSSMADDFPNSPYEIPNGTKYAFKQSMIDTGNSYPCDDALFAELITTYKIQFWYNYQYIEFEFISVQENKIQDISSGLCNPYMRLDFNFTSMEITEINQFINEDYYNTTLIISIDNIDRSDNQNFGSTYLPFAGVGDYYQNLEYVEIEDANVVQGLQNTALILGTGMALIALGSTAYWNPVVDSFRRFGND